MTMCQYGSCHADGDKVSLLLKGDPQERPKFCSLEHAALWCMGRATGISPHRDELVESTTRLMAKAGLKP